MMDKYNLTIQNKIYNFNDKHIKKIKTTCQPLIDFSPFKYFFYSKMFNDGHCSIICHDLDLLKILISSSDFLKQLFSYDLEIMKDDKNYKSIWPEEESDIKDEEILNFLKHHNGLKIVKKNEADQSLEIMFFLTNINRSQGLNFCFNNFNLLNRFIYFFKTKLSKLIEDLQIQKLSFYFDELHQNKRTLRYNFQPVSSFIKCTKVKKYKIGVLQGPDVFIPERQIECLYQVSKGKTAKEVARTLDISYRTVQTHINILKEKVDIHSKSQILKCLSEDLINFMETNLLK